MAKIKERKSESWKPGLFHDDGFISKNKKRKEKRMSLNLSAKKIDTEEFVPFKKSALAFNKTKDNLKLTPNKFLSPALDKKHTPKKKDTPMPGLGSKKQANTSMPTPNARKFSIADSPTAVPRKLNGTPQLKPNPSGSPKKNKEIAGTPKVKQGLAGTPKVNLEPVIKSSLKKKAQKFIDYEAEEGEEPVADKEIKPYVKGQKKKSISFKFNDQKMDSDSDDSSDDSEEVAGPRGFLDEEASEGEETDESGTDESDEDEDDDGEDSDTFKSFLAGDSDDEEGSDVSDEEDDDGSDEEDNDEEGSDEEGSDVSDEDDSDDSDEKPQPKLKKRDSKITAKPAPAPVVSLNQTKKEKAEKLQNVIEPSVKKSKVAENIVQKVQKNEKLPKEENSPAKVTSPPPTEYAGFIKYLPSTITSDQIKKALASAVTSENIVSVILKKNNKKTSNRCFVYVPDEDSLDKLENKPFTIGKTTFKVFRARENKKLIKTRPLAFLPRVPMAIDNEKLKSIIESDVGVGKVITLKSKKENDALKTRNVVVELANDEVLKKVVYKGSYNYKGTDIVVRQAFESGFSIPIYKVVFSGIPENSNEALLKKAIEMKIGKGSVITVKFSFRKKSFAFVTLNNEQSQKKLLEPDTDISIKETKLQILEFKPRQPKKRGPAKKKDKESPAAKKQKIDPSSSEPQLKKSKKKKSTPPVSKSSVPLIKTEQNLPQKKNEPVQKSSKKKNKSLKQSQNNVQSPQKLKPQQQQSSPSPSSPPKNKKAKNQVPDKKAILNSKLEAKKTKRKDKKMKKQQVNLTD